MISTKTMNVTKFVRGFASKAAAARASNSAKNLSPPLGRQALIDSKRVVVKVGTAVVSHSNGRLALSRMGGLVEEIARLHQAGKQTMLVSSGAVGVGRMRLDLDRDRVKDPSNIVDRQACAASGQETLMSTYTLMFERMGIKCAQVLITQQDFLHQDSYLSLTATLTRLVELGIVPIINENDVVTGLQLDRKGPRVFSDNDMLSALVASGVDADGLALLTDVEGVFNMPPDQPGAKRISVYSPEADIAIGQKSTMGRGGMASKISAASLAAEGGVNTVVASGYDVANVNRVFDGADIGTLFKAAPRPTSSQRWLSFMAGADGSVQLRKSAAERMMASTEDYPLLMEDITNVSGSFDAKEPVRLLDHNGQEFARAITQKSAEDITATIEGEGNLLASLKLATPANVYFIPNPQ